MSSSSACTPITPVDIIVKYELPPDYNESLPMPDKLELLKAFLKKEIRKELKIKEGAENFRKASSDKKSLSNIDKIVRQSNNTLQDLQDDLAEVDRFIVEYSRRRSNDGFNTLNQSSLESTGEDSDGGDVLRNGANAASQGTDGNGQTPMVNSAYEHFVHNLLANIAQMEKRINIEQKVKHGAENMIHSIDKKEKNRKLMEEAQKIAEESKMKMEYMRMQMVRMKQQLNLAQNENSKLNQQLVDGVGSIGTGVDPLSLQKLPDMQPSLELRIEECRYRLHVECAVVEGSKNAIKSLQLSKSIDKKALQEAQSSLIESSQKVDLFRKSLEDCRTQLPTDSHISKQLKYELDLSQSANSHIYSPKIVDISGKFVLESFPM